MAEGQGGIKDKRFRMVEEIGWIVRTKGEPAMTLAILREGLRVILDEERWVMGDIKGQPGLVPVDFNQAEEDLRKRVTGAWDYRDSRGFVMLRKKPEPIPGVNGQFESLGYTVLSILT